LKDLNIPTAGLVMSQTDSCYTYAIEVMILKRVEDNIEGHLILQYFTLFVALQIS